MDADAKKTALRMIPYGLYALNVLGKDDKGVAYTFFKSTEVAGGTLGG